MSRNNIDTTGTDHFILRQTAENRKKDLLDKVKGLIGEGLAHLSQDIAKGSLNNRRITKLILKGHNNMCDKVDALSNISFFAKNEENTNGDNS